MGVIEGARGWLSIVSIASSDGTRTGTGLAWPGRGFLAGTVPGGARTMYSVVSLVFLPRRLHGCLSTGSSGVIAGGDIGEYSIPSSVTAPLTEEGTVAVASLLRRDGGGVASMA